MKAFREFWEPEHDLADGNEFVAVLVLQQGIVVNHSKPPYVFSLIIIL